MQKILPKKRQQSQYTEAQQRKRTRKKAEREVCNTLVKHKRKKVKAEIPQNQRMRTRFVLQDSEHHEPGTDQVSHVPYKETGFFSFNEEI